MMLSIVIIREAVGRTKRLTINAIFLLIVIFGLSFGFLKRQ